jgi:hypothetical protein
VTQAEIREQAKEYLHRVAAHDDNRYANVYVIEGQRIDGETALDMAELALRTQKPIAVTPSVTVAQALELARRVAAIEDRLTAVEAGGNADAVVRETVRRQRTAVKGGGGEGQTA